MLLHYLSYLWRGIVSMIWWNFKPKPFNPLNFQWWNVWFHCGRKSLIWPHSQLIEPFDPYRSKDYPQGNKYIITEENNFCPDFWFCELCKYNSSHTRLRYTELLKHSLVLPEWPRWQYFEMILLQKQQDVTLLEPVYHI